MPRQRAVLVLRYWEQLSESEAADMLRCSLGTAKASASRGLARLREVTAAWAVEGTPAKKPLANGVWVMTRTIEDLLAASMREEAARIAAAVAVGLTVASAGPGAGPTGPRAGQGGRSAARSPPAPLVAAVAPPP